MGELAGKEKQPIASTAAGVNMMSSAMGGGRLPAGGDVGTNSLSQGTIDGRDVQEQAGSGRVRRRKSVEEEALA